MDMRIVVICLGFEIAAEVSSELTIHSENDMTKMVRRLG